MVDSKGDDLRALHMTRAAEQRKVFSLLRLSLNDAFCHRLILIQQQSEGAVFLRPSSQLQLHPLAHSWPKGAFGQSLHDVYVSNTRVCVNELVCVGSFVSSPLPVGSGASQIEFQRKTGIERRFMLLTPGWSSELKRPLHLRSDNVTDGFDTRTQSFVHILIILSGQLVHEVQN